jgi:hypothetical protein
VTFGTLLVTGALAGAFAGTVTVTVGAGDPECAEVDPAEGAADGGRGADAGASTVVQAASTNAALSAAADPMILSIDPPDGQPVSPDPSRMTEAR